VMYDIVVGLAINIIEIRLLHSKVTFTDSGYGPNMYYKLTLQKSLQIYKKYDIIIRSLLR